MKQNFLELSQALENNNKSEIQRILQNLDHVTIAEFLQTTDYDNREKFIRKHLSDYPDVLPELEQDLILETTEILSEKRFTDIVKNLPVDEIAKY